MKQKIYPKEVTDEIKKIGMALKTIFDDQKSNLRTLAKFSDMSVNSVKTVLSGHTANIASYSLVAKALGVNLIDVVADVKLNPADTELLSVPKQKPEEQDPINSLLIQ